MKIPYLDMELLKQVFGGDGEQTYYLDLKTGEVLTSQDMYPEELENRKRFLQVPDYNSPEVASDPLEEFQQYVQEVVHEPDLRSRLELAIQQGEPLAQCERILLEYYPDLDGWDGFQSSLHHNCVMKWLASKGIEPR
jgi:hypothetical protein